MSEPWEDESEFSHILDDFDVGTAKIEIEIKIGDGSIGGLSLIIDDIRKIEKFLGLMGMDYEQFVRELSDV